jgi:hypothetical protein
MLQLIKRMFLVITIMLLVITKVVLLIRRVILVINRIFLLNKWGLLSMEKYPQMVKNRLIYVYLAKIYASGGVSYA